MEITFTSLWMSQSWYYYCTLHGSFDEKTRCVYCITSLFYYGNIEWKTKTRWVLAQFEGRMSYFAKAHFRITYGISLWCPDSLVGGARGW